MASQPQRTGYLRQNLVVVGVFVLILIVLEGLFGFVFIDQISDYIEAERKKEFIESWTNYLKQRKAIHESKVTGYAWWDEMAAGFMNRDPDYIVNEIFGYDTSITREYDVFLAFGADLEPYFLSIDGHNTIDEADIVSALRDPVLERSFLETANASYYEHRDEMRAFLAKPAGERASLDHPIVWHYVSGYGGRTRLLTISPICQNDGWPVSEGFIVFGYSFDRLIAGASDVIPITDVTIATEQPTDAYATVTHEGPRPNEHYYVSFRPRILIADVARYALGGFIIAQILLSAIVFSFVSPYFTRRATRQLEEIITQRTEELKEANAALEARQRQILRELALARVVQQNLLPDRILKLHGLEVVCHYEPVEDLGGDIYDVLDFGEGRLGILVADVAGHGVPAALIAMMLKLSFVNHAAAETAPGETLTEINRELSRLLNVGDYLTAMYLKVDARENKVEYATAGHHAALLLRAGSGQIEEISTPGPIIGLQLNTQYRSDERLLEKHDRIIVFTDGIIEQFNMEKEAFGESRLRRILLDSSGQGLTHFRERLLAELGRHRAEVPIEDDLTLVAVQVGEESTAGTPVDITIASDHNHELHLALRQGRLLYARADYEGCARVFVDIVETHPQHTVSFYNLALIHLRLGKPEQGLRYLESYLAQNPQSKKARALRNRLTLLQESQ